MIKKIILVDRGTKLVNAFLKENDVVIEVLIVDTIQQKNIYIDNKKINNIYTVEEIDTWDSTVGIDFGIIKRNKDLENSVESALTRYINDYNLKKYYYYLGLSFWCEKFLKKNIDVVIINGLNHGLLYDGILLGLARKEGVPCYTINPIGFYKSFLYDELNRNFIKIKNKKEVLNIDEYLVDGAQSVYNLNFNNRIRNNFLVKILYKMGGEFLLEFFGNVKNRKLFKEINIASSGFKTTFFKKLKCLYELNKAKKYLEKISENKLYNNIKYIYYPLQFEPEGTTQVRLTLESQIFIIKMISETLPDNWKLYVKEHPHQYKLNNSLLAYYAPNIELFKTKDFYKKIKSMKNVKILDTELDSKEIIKNSCAVASTVGSILLETVILKKPILLFSELHPLIKDKEILTCFSHKECEVNLKKLNSGYKPNYKNTVQVLNDYILLQDEDIVFNTINLLKD